MVYKYIIYKLLSIFICAFILSLNACAYNNDKPYVSGGLAQELAIQDENILDKMYNSSSQGHSYQLKLISESVDYQYPLNFKTEWIIKPQFKSGGPFYDGMAAVQSNISTLWGYINKTGINIIPYQYNTGYLYNFRNGITEVFEHESMNKPILLDKEGNIALRGKPEDSFSLLPGSAYCDGLIPVSLKNDNVGYIDLNGNIKITLDMYLCDNFSNGLAVIVDRNGKYGYVDTHGNIIIPPQYDEYWKFQ